MAEVAKIESKYERLRKIGIGSYGVVFKCVNRQSGQIVAIKRYSENDTDPIIRKIAMREVRMLRQLKHPNLIQLIEVFRRKRRLHLVFDYCELTVLDVIEKYTSNCPLNLIKKIIWQLVNGVSYCHSHNCIHRDIKPENILINQYGVVKLCDFGFARNLVPNQQYYHSLSSANNVKQLQPEQEARLLGVPYNSSQSNGGSTSNGRATGKSSGSSNYSDSKENATGERLALTEYVATRWYRAPELLVGEVYYDTKIDIWAIGCVTAELMRGEPVWPGKTDLDQLFMIKNSLGPLTTSQTHTLVNQNLYDQASIERLIDNTVQSPGGRHGDSGPLETRLPNRVGQAAIEFVLVCLKIDPAKRPTSDKLLRHPYIHSARMAQFVTGSSSGTESAKITASANDEFTRQQQQQNVRRLSKQHNRSNSEALILAANSSNLPTSNQQQMMMALQEQHQRRKSPSASINDELLRQRKKFDQFASKRQLLDPIADQRMSAVMNEASQNQHKRKRPPQAKNIGSGSETASQRPSLIPISSPRLRPTVKNPTTNQRQHQQLIQLPPAPSDSASSSSLSVNSGLALNPKRLSRSNGNLTQTKQPAAARQSTTNTNNSRVGALSTTTKQAGQSPSRLAKGRLPVEHPRENNSRLSTRRMY